MVEEIEVIKDLEIGSHADNGNNGDGKISLSKTQKKKLEKYERDLALKKSKRKDEKIKSREKFKVLRQEGGPCKVEIRNQQLDKLQKTFGSGVKVCLDFQFEDFMTDKELNHLANQAKRVYSSNKAAVMPFDLHFINLKENSKTYKLCCDKNTGFGDYLLTFSDLAANELFPTGKIVYLSPDSEQTLTDMCLDTVYVIGGLVDDSVKKNTSQQYCRNANISSARLPIPENMARAEKGSYKQILTVNQVFDILLNYHQTKDWKTAFVKNVPAKTGFIIE